MTTNNKIILQSETTHHFLSVQVSQSGVHGRLEGLLEGFSKNDLSTSGQLLSNVVECSTLVAVKLYVWVCKCWGAGEVTGHSGQ